MEDILVYTAKCCKPTWRDAVVGYVTRGKGIAVHTRTCANVQDLKYDHERKIDVEWATESAVRDKEPDWYEALADRIAVLRTRHNIAEIALEEAKVLLNGASVEPDQKMLLSFGQRDF
jgi:(p)ppGpp synthase/HD superfamily hydrolase